MFLREVVAEQRRDLADHEQDSLVEELLRVIDRHQAETAKAARADSSLWLP